jgi:putative transcriptional regulator
VAAAAEEREDAHQMDSLRGQLLVSSPKILDPNFRRTVVLIAEHTDEGAMGLVLNRPAASTVVEAVPDLAWLTGEEEQVYVGGPVAETAVIVLEVVATYFTEIRGSTIAYTRSRRM